MVDIPNEEKDVASQFVEGCDHQLADYQYLMGQMGSKYNVKNGKDSKPDYDIDEILLNNGYKFTFECPLITSEMQKNSIDDKSVFCQVCTKRVSIVNDIEDFDTKIDQGSCVSFDPNKLFKSTWKSTRPSRFERIELCKSHV